MTVKFDERADKENVVCHRVVEEYTFADIISERVSSFHDVNTGTLVQFHFHELLTENLYLQWEEFDTFFCVHPNEFQSLIVNSFLDLDARQFSLDRVY